MAAAVGNRAFTALVQRAAAPGRIAMRPHPALDPAAFGFPARFPRDRVRIAGASRKYVRRSDEGEPRRSHFCPECGATVYFVLDSVPDVVAVPVGAFADPAFPEPRFSVWEARRHGWVTPPAGAEHHH